ncbi:AMP-binding protein [Ardenticatena maritima]|nr:AMP-binding protein [Ardenticatena maritima]KPL89150.1 AMP-dependent synthetase [Ardenticatena maritima]
MSDTFPFGQPIVWEPSPEYVNRSRLRTFMERHGIATFDELMSRSTEDIEWFWEAVLEDLGIEFYEPYERIVDLSRGIQWPQWCVGGKMNIVHNCLDKWMGTPTQNRVAVRWEGESGDVRVLTYRELYREVNRVAAALRAAGIGKGDAVGIYMPMVPEIVVALLAIAKIGGVILPLFSGYGAGAVATRLADADAKALFTADAMVRRGRVIPMKPTADEALNDVPTIEKVIVYRYVGLDETPMQAGRDVWWDEFVAGQPTETPTERTDAEDLLMIIYTSGTTGRPKGAVHTHCGFPIKSAQDMAHGFDVQPQDTMFWMTDMGWMMGPWEVFGVTILGASMLLYDGAPDYPDVDRVWALVERHGVTHLGLAPTFVRAIMRHGEEPVKRHDLSSLYAFGSTGEAWNPDPWMWLFEKVGGKRIPIINYSGGTEISGGILLGNVLRPLKPCAFSAPAPGMAADVVDEEGRSIRNAVGELVIRKPWIGMTRGFWKDPERYLQTYWSRFPNVWVHGDFAAVDEDGMWYILGRSDDTIKVAGKRVGPAEVESVLVSHPAVAEAAAIGVPDEVKGQVIVGFVVLQPGYSPSEELRAELRELVAREMGKPLTPKDIRFVTDIPKTRNAKVMRRIVRAAYLGQPTGDTSALVNPEAVDAIRHSQ